MIAEGRDSRLREEWIATEGGVQRDERLDKRGEERWEKEGRRE
jgi:hypothetical protein